MLTRQEQAKQRWGGAHQEIDAWLHERQEMLIEYFKLAGLPPYNKRQAALPSAEEIRNFCGLLVDYVSSGHFEIYDRIVRNSTSEPDQTEALASELFPLISETTEVALAFHDQYGNSVDETQLNEFDRRLSELAEVLELRMEFEDRLLQSLEQQQLL
ncbi:Regulator of sigma D [Pseudidiomarina piscicola]|uniref:Regulator of sigma D n=1 Tax=Pseudidiomarina piscicola TaxID=2614830 RepID=A0A6S6WPS3_9GAMM|nr:sigma D regulator [Pseudidiomarina piscicola]CAB0151758.1 Regulator of sigma D [Pseudidiomarina piscicola]VZT41213.1 Regulator of sigma D [Pseudomonas aeruginosa]